MPIGGEWGGVGVLWWKTLGGLPLMKSAQVTKWLSGKVVIVVVVVVHGGGPQQLTRRSTRAAAP